MKLFNVLGTAYAPVIFDMQVKAETPAEAEQLVREYARQRLSAGFEEKTFADEDEDDQSLRLRCTVVNQDGECPEVEIDSVTVEQPAQLLSGDNDNG